MPECINDEMVEMLVRSNLQPTDNRSGIHDLSNAVYDKGTARYARATRPIAILD